MIGFGSDRSGVHERLGARERERARRLREPLIPARREPEHRRVDRRDRPTGIPGPEPCVLVVSGSHREMRLARAGDDPAVGRDDERGVVAEAAIVRRLVARGVHVGAGFTRAPGDERVGGAARERFRLGSGVDRISSLDCEVRRARQLGQAHEVRALLRR